MFTAGQLVGFWAADGVPIPAPTVDWNFAVDNSLVDTSSTYTISHTRVDVLENAAYWDSSGVLQIASTGDPRFGYHPVTLASLGLLTESQYNSQHNHNEDFSQNPAWTMSEASLTTNQASWIDGNTVADLLYTTTANSTHYTLSATGVSDTATSHITHGIYAKAETYDYMMMECTNGTDVFKIWVDLTDGSIGDTSGNSVSYGVEPMGDGWYFIWAHCISVATDLSQTAYHISTGTTSGDESFAGDGSGGIYICGALLHNFGERGAGHHHNSGGGDTDQVEETVTVDCSGFWNDSEGTILIEYFQFGWQCQWSMYGVVFQNTGTPTTDYVHLYAHPAVADGGPKWNAGIRDGGSVELQFGPTGSAPVEGVSAYNKVAFAYKANDCQLVGNGEADPAGVDTSVVLPSGINSMRIGANQSGDMRTGQYYQRIRYWNTRLTETQMVALTT